MTGVFLDLATNMEVHKSSTWVWFMHTRNKWANEHFYQLSFQDFSCAWNPIRYIHPDAFIRLLVLNSLKMQATQLHQLSSLKHVGHSLISLQLSRSMRFEGNHAWELSYLRKIEVVNMPHNGLKYLPLGLDYIAKSVRKLDFDFNCMRSIASIEGVNFTNLRSLHLQGNRITHLRPEIFTTPHLEVLNLHGNDLITLDEFTRYSWGSSLPKHTYLAIHLPWDTWHCNGSLTWMHSNLYRFNHQIIYAQQSLKAYITHVQMLVCKSPDTRRDTGVVPKDIIESINITVRSLRELAG